MEHTRAGFFDRANLNKMALIAVGLSESRSCKGVYFTLNPVHPDLLSRRANWIGPAEESLLTHGPNILRRRWLFIDVDPVRTSEVSSSDAEKERSLVVARNIRRSLSEQAWPDPIFADSGNGYHLLYRVDVSSDDGGLVERCLSALASEFDDSSAKVDKKVYEPNRICKLYGTYSRKGDNTPSRPHRRSQFLELPNELIPVATGLLESLASRAPTDSKPQSTNGHVKNVRQQRQKSSRTHDEIIRCASSYLSQIDRAISGQAGHAKLYHAAATLTKRFALSVEDSLPLLRDWNVGCQPPWDEYELLRKLIDTKQSDGPEGDLIRILHPQMDLTPEETKELLAKLDVEKSIEIRNAVKSDGQVVAIPMTSILGSIKRATVDWPRRVGSTLFVHQDGCRTVDWIMTQTALFGWLGSKTGSPPKIMDSFGLHGKGEIFEELRRTATEHKAVESLPHEPPLDGHYYAYPTPEPGDGQTFANFIERFFNPETLIDGDLIKAMFATVLWGGPGGSRPAFLIASDAGRGSGKSKLASIVAGFAGGPLDISANEEVRDMKERILSPDGQRKRVALLDNVKTHKFSWAELESLITSPTISGRQMYVGEASRPNTITWLITLNGISLSADMAQRVAIIKVNPPEYSGNWDEAVQAFAEMNRDALIADLIGFLRSDAYPLERYSRWGRWEREVLSRLPDPAEAQKVLLERQAAGNVEEDEAETVVQFFRGELESLGYETAEQKIFIPSAVLAKWFNLATNERYSVVAVGRIFSQKIHEKTIKRFERQTHKGSARGVVWVGESADMFADLKDDLELRISISHERRRGF